MIIRITAFLLLAIPLSQAAQVDVLPETKHQRFLTFGQFFDEKSAFLIRNSTEAQGAFGSSLALAEISDWTLKPQLILTGTVDVSFQTHDYFSGLRVKSFDARFGATIDFNLSEYLIGSFGLLHFSGHLADGTDYTSLTPLDLGHDALFLRLIFDQKTWWRIGGTLRAYVYTNPTIQASAFDQFLELFPLGTDFSTIHPTPYLAFGLEESGVQKLDITYHIQIGVYFGNHLEPRRQSLLRLALGYYNGADPRLKYAHFQNAKDHFLYGGVLLNY
jgi:hypothetical protein